MATSQSFKPDCLRGRVAFITGGASGIGLGISRVFLSHGCDLAIASRSAPRLQAAADMLKKEFPNRRCVWAAMDVRNPDSVEKAVDLILEQLRHIDILINCAAGNFLSPLDALSFKGFRTVMEIDAFGCFNVSKVVKERAFAKQPPLEGEDCAAECMRFDPAATRGIIINISMTLHYTGCLLQTHAGAAKAAIDAMTLHMGVEWGPQGIRVCGVAPGPIAGTVGFSKLVAKDPSGEESQRKDGFERYIPLQRLGHSRDIGHSCLFLCLPEASFITGTTLVVDGGQWLTTNNFPVMEADTREPWADGGCELPQAKSRL